MGLEPNKVDSKLMYKSSIDATLVLLSKACNVVITRGSWALDYHEILRERLFKAVGLIPTWGRYGTV